MNREERFRKSGNKGESKVKQWISENGYENCYYSNAILRYLGFIEKNASTEIDGLLVLENAILVFEIKNWNKISRYDAIRDIYHVRINVYDRKLKSPKEQNRKHIEIINKLLRIPIEYLVNVCVIITDDGSDKIWVHVENDYNNHQHLIRFDQIKSVVDYYKSKKNNLFERDEYIKRIEMANWGGIQEYIDNHKQYAIYREKCKKEGVKAYGFYKCDICGNQLVLGKKDGFYAKCTGYPKVCSKKTIPIAKIEDYVVNNEEEIAERLIKNMTEMEYKKRIEEYNNRISIFEERIKNLNIYIESKEKELFLIDEELEKKRFFEERRLLKQEVEEIKIEVSKIQEENSDKDEIIRDKDNIINKLNNEINHQKELYQKTIDFKMRKIVARLLNR